MPLAIWLAVGLTAGVLAFAFRSSGYGLFGDAVAGMVGAILGSWLVAAFRIHIPLDGLLRTILVAFLGAGILIILLHASLPQRRFAWSR